MVLRRIEKFKMPAELFDIYSRKESVDLFQLMALAENRQSMLGINISRVIRERVIVSLLPTEFTQIMSDADADVCTRAEFNSGAL